MLVIELLFGELFILNLFTFECGLVFTCVLGDVLLVVILSCCGLFGLEWEYARVVVGLGMF